MMANFHVVDDFLPEADAMRRAVEDHFRNPESHTASTHQVWNYWHVAGLYTYLRTTPDRVIPTELVELFMLRLAQWCLSHLGFNRVSPPKMSLYVDGCRQALHNDAANGRWGYVFSLSRWEGRQFCGGETVLLHNDAYWNSERVNIPSAGQDFYDLIEPRFNRLLIFDDRLIHGVERVEGTMDPMHARVVLHGHITEGEMLVEGALSPAIIIEHLQAACRDMGSRLHCALDVSTGALGLEIRIDPSGKVEDIVLLSNHLSRRIENGPSPTQTVLEILDALRNITFPSAKGRSRAVFPLTLD